MYYDTSDIMLIILISQVLYQLVDGEYYVVIIIVL